MVNPTWEWAHGSLGGYSEAVEHHHLHKIPCAFCFKPSLLHSSNQHHPRPRLPSPAPPSPTLSFARATLARPFLRPRHPRSGHPRQRLPSAAPPSPAPFFARAFLRPRLPSPASSHVKLPLRLRRHWNISLIDVGQRYFRCGVLGSIPSPLCRDLHDFCASVGRLGAILQTNIMDIISQLQEQVNTIAMLALNTFGTLRRDAPPVRLSPDYPEPPATNPSEETVNVAEQSKAMSAALVQAAKKGSSLILNVAYSGKDDKLVTFLLQV
uniref:Mediator of RNA polymerase II transcription subunit 21 n=1 Tax=Ananas comosus var. bracteatus TaxID=296719 RepID=A0A6V7P5R1_ANACO|nr:unnamed protein product [Ananas comosus var. bracteatus]